MSLVRSFASWVDGIDWIMVIGLVVLVCFACIASLVISRHIIRLRYNRLHRLFLDNPTKNAEELTSLIPRPYPMPLLVRDEKGRAEMVVKQLTVTEHFIYTELLSEINEYRKATCINNNHWFKYRMHVASTILDLMKRGEEPKNIIPQYTDEDASTDEIIRAVLMDPENLQLFVDNEFGTGQVDVLTDILVHPEDPVQGANALESYQDTTRPVSIEWISN